MRAKTAAFSTAIVALCLGTSAGVALVGCEDREKLCRAIGETRVSALQPRDRIYYEENCLPREAPEVSGPVVPPVGSAARNRSVYSGPASGPEECVVAWDAEKRECVTAAPAKAATHK